MLRRSALELPGYSDRTAVFLGHQSLFRRMISERAANYAA